MTIDQVRAWRSRSIPVSTEGGQSGPPDRRLGRYRAMNA